MIKNTPFNDEWNKLQKNFWSDLGSNFVNLSNSTTDRHGVTQSDQSVLFNQWLTEVDKCWDDYACVTSTDIDSIYKKISSSSRFFINFTESVTTTKQCETLDNLIKRNLDGFTNETSDKKADDEDAISQQHKDSSDGTVNHTYWNIPLENWQQQAAFFTNQHPPLSALSCIFEDAASNPEFSAAVEAYLIALHKYQLVFLNLFKASVKQADEILKSNIDKPASAKKTMAICLEVLEANYTLLISGDHYSQAYADVVNSWMLMLNKSNKSFADFVQTNTSSVEDKPDGLDDEK